MAELTVEIVTPGRIVYQGRAAFVAATSMSGEIGIFPRHAALVTRLGTGEARVTKPEGDRDELAIRRGFLKVENDRVTILVTDALRGAEVDREAVTAELVETKAALRHPESDEAFETLLERRAWCEARLRIPVA